MPTEVLSSTSSGSQDPMSERTSRRREPEHALRVHMLAHVKLGDVLLALRALQSAYIWADAFVEERNLRRLCLRALPPLFPPETDLLFERASFKSPGFWEFLGTLNPLQILATYIQQRHERLKDYAYRNSAEEERLELDNQLLRHKIIAERVALLRDSGVSDAKIRKMLFAYFTEPLVELDRHLAKGLITGAEIVDLRRRDQ